jgi:hypothetical protein
MPQIESQQKSKQFITKISDEAERKHGEKMLDEAIENTFPASDPVSAEQPVHALSLPQIKSVRIDGAAHQGQAALGYAQRAE